MKTIKRIVLLAICGLSLKAASLHAMTDPTEEITVINDGKAAVSIVILDPAPDQLMKLSEGVINDTIKRWSGVALPVITQKADVNLTSEKSIVLAKIENLLRYLPGIDKSNAVIREVLFADDQGFACTVITINGRDQIVVTGKTSRAVFNGAIWLRDMCIGGSGKNLAIERVSKIRVPQLAIRAAYCLSIYGIVPEYSVEDWDKIYQSFARDGMERVYFWVSGMFPSKKFPQTFNRSASTNTKIRTVVEIRQLIEKAHAMGLKFYLGSGVFAWSTAGYLGEGLPGNGAATEAEGLCPANPQVRQRHKEYFMEMIDALPEADGFFFEIRDEMGECRCEQCQEPLAVPGSKQYGAFEISFVQEFAAEVWKKYPHVNFCMNVGYAEHKDDLAYYQSIANMRDPRFEWLDCRESWKFPVGIGERVQGAYLSRNLIHWVPFYSLSLEFLIRDIRNVIEFGYNGHCTAFEPGYATADFYYREKPYPTDVINYAVTGFAYRELTWDPIYAATNLKKLLHKKFFGKDAPDGLAEDLYYLRDFVAHHSRAIRSFSMEWVDTTGQLVPPAVLADMVKNIFDVNANQIQQDQRHLVQGQLQSLRYIRDEGLGKLTAIESHMEAARKNASPKTSETLDKMQKLIDDIRKYYSLAVPSPAALDDYIISAKKSMASPDSSAKPKED